MTARAYATRVVEVQAMNLSTLRIGTYQRGEVYYIESGETAWSSDSYSKASAARLQANRMLPRYEHHLNKTGKRFEVERREQRAAKQAAEKAAIEARKRVREAAPDLLDAAEEAIALIDDMARFVGKMALQDYSLFNSAPMKLRAAIAKARGK